MKRVALLVVLMSIAGGACKKAPPPESPPAGSVAGSGSAVAAGDPWKQEAAKKDPLRAPLLWSIEKGGNTTYFLGTMHVGVDAESRLPDLVWAKLDGVPTFAMETNLADASLGDFARTDKGTLHADLGDADWKKLQIALTPKVAAQIDTMKPMVAATMLSLRGMTMTAPMDGILVGRASNEHKQIVYLEPAAKQSKLLEKWMDVKALKAMLDDLDEGERHTKEMVDAYIAGDETKIVALSDGERDDALKHGYTAAEYDQEMNDMLYDRNKSWIDAIEKLHAAGGGFVAVGAMHLVGKDSVLDLLAKRGYKVTRLHP